MSGTANDDQINTLFERRFSRRTLFRGVGVTGLGLTAAALVGCDGDEDRLEAIRERGYVRIGFANEAPYGYADEEGNITGQAPDVAREVLRRMGIEEMAGDVVPFGSLIPGLQARRFDMIAAGMFINPDRCAQILFSDPDYCIPQAFGVQAGNPLGLNNFEDVAANPDARLGVLAGAVEEGYALDSGVPEGQLERFDDTPALAEALQAGRIDAFALTTLSVREQIERLGDPNLEMTDAFVPVIDGVEQAGCGGYGFHPDDQEFRDAFNEVLNEMKQNDEIVPITEQHGFFEEEIGDARDRTSDELCDGVTP